MFQILADNKCLCYYWSCSRTGNIATCIIMIIAVAILLVLLYDGKRNIRKQVKKVSVDKTYEDVDMTNINI